jgi:PAS domain S-box-containing protein
MEGPLRDSGIDIIGDVPWGTHFCLFYETIDDLSDILIPYFKAGLENNEFCMWVTSEPLAKAEAEKAISKAVPRFNRLLKSGQIEIVPHDEWYLKDGVFNLQHVLDGWIEKLEEALANGYSGLRATGNTAWLESEDWKDFTQYEREIDSIIGEYRMMALCTYSLDKCSTTDVLDVVKNHEFALLKHKGAWELIESSERKRAVEALRDSEARYRDLYDQAPNAYFSVGTDGLVKRANLAACELLGCSLEQLVGSTIFDLYADSPYGKTKAKVVFDKFRSGESVSNEELQMQRFDGEVIWVSLSVNPIKDMQGKVLESRSSVVDVTELKKTVEALEESETKYRFLTENMNDLVWIIDLGFRTTYVNPSVEKVLGFTTEERMAQTPKEQVTPETLEMTYKVLAEELQRDKEPGVDPDRTRSLELDYYHKDGSIRCLETIVSFVRDEDGNPVGIYGVSRDISERKRAEEELKRINAELDGFAHTVSHDLRGPITTIMGANLVLQSVLQKREESKDNQFETDIQELLEIIDAGVNKAETLIADILALAEAGQVPEEVSDVDVSEVVETILRERNDDIKGRGITVEVEDGLGSVRANPTHVYQVFANLIGNAIKHNDNENPVLKVSYLGDDENGLHRYLVRDNGSGVRPEHLDEIFVPFFKGKTGETGIGLATVEKIVKVYHGEIRAYIDNGACFEFTLRDY